MTAAAEHAHAVDAAARPQDRGFFETENRSKRLLDLSVAAQLMGKAFGGAKLYCQLMRLLSQTYNPAWIVHE